MVKITDIPIAKIRSWIKDGADVERKRDELVRIAIFVDPEAPRDLVLWIKEAFIPQMETGRIHVEKLAAKTSAVINPDSDCAIIIAGGSDSLICALLDGLVHEQIPTILLAHSVLDIPALKDEYSEQIGRAFGTSSDVLLNALADWIVSINNKDIAIAANFSFARKAAAQKHIKASAQQNAVVGAAPFIPGSDMAIMMANQVKMAFEIAAIYGKKLSAERIPEILGIAGGGVALRSLARTAVGFIPGVGWAIKGSLGYAGTLAMGNSLIARFELGSKHDEEQHVGEQRSEEQYVEGRLAGENSGGGQA